MAGAAHLGSFIVLNRDGGRVRLDEHPLIDYALSNFDRGNMLAGVQAAAEIHTAAGARTIYLPHGTLPILKAKNGVLCNPELLAQLPALS